MKTVDILGCMLLASTMSIISVNGARRKELQVKKDIKYPPYDDRSMKIFNEIVEIIGETTEDSQGNWLRFGQPCDPDLHKDRLSNNYPLSKLKDKSHTQQLCSIFEDLVCDTVEKECKCWTAGGVGRMEWQPHDTSNQRKESGRCVMTSRQRCGILELPPGFYPHVNFPMLRELPCDTANKFHCETDVDGVYRCTDEEGHHDDSDHAFDNHAARPVCLNCSFYIAISFITWVLGFK